VDQGAWRLKGIRMCTSHRLDRMTSNSASAHFDKMSHLQVLGMPFAFADGRIVTGANLASAKVTAEEAVKVFDKL
jgi:putative intracellular protease/amidase